MSASFTNRHKPVSTSVVLSSCAVFVLLFAIGVASISLHASAVPQCNQPIYLAKLASKVQSAPKFLLASQGLQYVLVNGENESATTGVVNATLVKTSSTVSNGNGTSAANNATEINGGVVVGGTPYYSPPRTDLTFYHYTVSSQPACASTNQGVTSVLWVRVPLNTDGSYNFSAMNIYQTPGIFTNSTTPSR